MPLHDYVLIEANESEEKVGHLILPIDQRPTYPTTGWVYSIGPKAKETAVGDFVVMEEEGTEIDHTYYDVFEITLQHDDGKIDSFLAPVEVEPVLKEYAEIYATRGEDHKITTKDLTNNTSVQFDAHNVVDWQFAQAANPYYKLEYVPTYMLEIVNEDDKLALFYLIRETKILARIQY